MKKISINNLIKKFDISNIERHLVYHYLKCNNLNYGGNAFFENYFKGYSINRELEDSIIQLSHNTLQELAVDMELLIPIEDKKVNGAFFTPSYIVDYIINTIEPKEDAKVIDLSCGSGAFLIGLVRYYTSHYNKSVLDCIKTNIYGADILDYNVIRSKLLLMLCGLEHSEIIDETEIKVIQCDSLKKCWNTKFDAVIGNPPYVKFQDMEDSTREYLVNEWDTTKYGTFNLYFAFFELGHKLLKDEGKLGYITPNNYFTSLSGECLRNFFQNNKCIYKITDFNATKIFDVQTYTSITFINKEQNESIEYSRIDSEEEPRIFLKNAIYTPNEYSLLNKKKWRLLCGNERANIYSIENIGIPLGELVNICVGIATLKDEIFFLNPKEEDDTFIFALSDNQTYKIEKEITRSVIKISDMKNQSDIEHNTRRIIFPYRISKGKPVVIDENTMESKYPFCYKYLLSKKNMLDSRGKGKHKYLPFYAYGRTQGLNRVGIKLLTPTFSKCPRFLLDCNEYSLFTNGYGIYLPERNSLFTNLLTQKENIDVLQKILNSIVMHYYIKKTSVSIEGGYPCYQKNFIEKFSIPEFSAEEIVHLRKMTEDDVNEYLIDKYQITW